MSFVVFSHRPPVLRDKLFLKIFENYFTKKRNKKHEYICSFISYATQKSKLTFIVKSIEINIWILQQKYQTIQI